VSDRLLITKALNHIEKLRRLAHAAPRDLSLAVAYWRGLENVQGDDYRSPDRLIDALRTAALLSPEGAYEFSRAYLELADLTGELPALDEPLRLALLSSIGLLSLEKAVVVEKLVTPNSMHQTDGA
jgi:hypothetical protein